MGKENLFINGFESWRETYYEIVDAMTLELERGKSSLSDYYSKNGRGGCYELASTLTNEFEALHANTVWDGEFFDEIESFLESKFNEL